MGMQQHMAETDKSLTNIFTQVSAPWLNTGAGVATRRDWGTGLRPSGAGILHQLIAVSTILSIATFWQPDLRAQDDRTAEVTADSAETNSTEANSVEANYTEEELKQIQLADRFLGILEKNPRRGTAMDRVYGHHIEFGTLDKFIAGLRQRAMESPDDGAVWMVLGLFESQRGRDADAAQAFAKAEELRADDALAPYYAAQSLLRIGENESGVAAMERAIERQPPRADLLEIFQQLGRVHQRAQRTEQAMAVWKRLEELFPGDARVLEQIAVTLTDEGAFDEALPRYEKLAETERDDYRKTMYRVTAAELKIKLQQRAVGIANLESILAELNPEGWLFRDVRRRIEDVFLRSNDQDSLVQYYEGWIAKHPEDVEAMARLARFLSGAARVPEATQWMEKALKLAPSRSDLRKAFIDQLVEQQRFTEAAEQYRQLCDAEPNNIDFLRDWGKLVLRDRSLDMQQRLDEAARIWNLILADRPSDAVVTAQVADLCRNAQMKERAFELYRQAVELAPTEPQYREYLGEFYFIEKQTDQALETWAGIAAPPNRNAENLARAAEVYNSFGFSSQAVESIAAAVELQPKELQLLLRASDYHSRAEKV
jgi:tetratricopeptide (TPR) repeat protein